MKLFWTIDIVEDNEIVRSLLRYELEKNNEYIIRTFESGEAYLKGDYSSHADLLILDYFLDSNLKSSKDGLMILKALKKTGFKKPVIFFSAQQHLGVVIKALKKGAVDYVSKDSDTFIEDINNSVNEVIANFKRQSNDRIYRKNLFKGLLYAGLSIGLIALVLFI